MEGEQGTEQLHKHLSACFRSVQPVANSVPKAAISDRKTKAPALKDAFAETKETLRLAFAWGIGESVVRCRELELSYIFEQVSKERMETYCDKILGGLMCRDSDYAQEMLRTLEAYLDNDGQLRLKLVLLFRCKMGS